MYTLFSLALFALLAYTKKRIAGRESTQTTRGNVLHGANIVFRDKVINTVKVNRSIFWLFLNITCKDRQ